MLNISLRHLRTVLAIQRTKRIGGAAKLLGLTQPAVSLQLRDLETEIGLRLFDRMRDGLHPTAAGQVLIEAALAIEERLLTLSDDFAAFKGGRRGLVRLGVVSTAKYFAPALMAAFKRDHPEIDMTLWVGNRAETIDSLRQHAVDIALMGRPPRDVPVRASVLGEHPLVIIGSPRHALAGAANIAKERIAREQFLVREPGSGTRISLEVYLGEIPGRIDNLGIEMGSNETIKQAVMADLGIALISAHTIAQEVESGRLCVLDVDGLPIRRQWFSVSRADRSITPVMELFEDFLRREGKHHLPSVPVGGSGPAGATSSS